MAQAKKPKGGKPAKEEKSKTQKQVKSETDKTKTDEHKSLSKKAKIVAIFAVIGATVLILVLSVALTGKPELTTAGLINGYAKEANYIKDIVESDDPDGLMGNEHEYISKSSWEDSRLKDISEDHAGTLEVFRNSKDAEVREWYFDKISETCSKYITVKKYGKDYYEQICDGLGYGTTYRNQTIVVRLSRSLTEEQVSEYKSKFNDLIKKYKIVEADAPSDDEVEKLKKEKEEKLEQVFQKQEEDFKNRLDGLASDMDSNIASVLSSLDESDLKSSRDDLTYLKTIPYFSDKIEGWEKQINSIADKIAQKKADDAKKAEEAEQARKVTKARTFSAGKYKVGKDIDAGTYNITAVSGSGNCFVRTSSSGYSTVNEMMSSAGGRFYITNYSNAYLGTGYEIEITSSLTVKFEITE